MRRNIQSNIIKHCYDTYWYKLKVSYIIFWLKNLIDLCSLKHCIAIENIFIIIVYILLVVHFNNCFKIYVKQKIKMIWQYKIVKIKNFVRQTKSPFRIYADFENISVPEENGKQNSDVPHGNNFQNHVLCSYGYKLACFDDQFSKSFKSYLGKDSVYKFIIKMIKEGKY